MCFEKKKFRLINQINGVCICSKCAPTGICPIECIARVTGLGFWTIANEIALRVNFMSIQVTRSLDTSQVKDRARKIWNESKAINESCPVGEYLCGRGIIIPKSEQIKSHPDLFYKEGDFQSSAPCMVSLIRNKNDSVVGIQLRWIADFEVKRKTRNWDSYDGGYIRINDAPEKGIIVVGEGIETTLAYAQNYNMPAWALIDAGNMMKFAGLGPDVALIIAGDNDSNGMGQKAAYTLMHKLRTSRPQERVPVKVDIPPNEGDWADWLPNNEHTDILEFRRKWTV